MELRFELAKSDLAQYHRRWGKLSNSSIRTIAHQIATGMYHMHSKCIVHRDLKPQNILMDKNDNVRICDFGLATAIGTNDDIQTPTNVVTRWYRALEVLLDSKTYGFPVDIWAYGMIVAQLAHPADEALLQGDSEIDQLRLTLDMLGAFAVDQWPEFRAYPYTLAVRPGSPVSVTSSRPLLESAGAHMVDMTLTAPGMRLTARDILEHPWFL